MRQWFSVANRLQLATFFSEIDCLICPLPHEPWKWQVTRPADLPPPARLPLLFDEDQVAGFAALRSGDFIRRALAFARRHVAEVEDYNDEMLHRALMATQQNAEPVGIVTEQHLMALFVVSLRRRSNVFADPDTTPVLQNQLLDPAIRVRLLVDRYL